jgi:type I restriction enzyme R subunit
LDISPLHNPLFNEADTRSKLIDPTIDSRGWTEEHILREETAGVIEIINGKPTRRTAKD